MRRIVLSACLSLAASAALAQTPAGAPPAPGRGGPRPPPLMLSSAGVTDGGIVPSGLVVMEDDKSVQPVYQPAPIIREPVLQANPQIEELLKPVFEKLDLVTLQTLNGRIQVGGEAAKDVAVDWLKQNGFLK